MGMKTYVLKEKSEPASNEMVWTFDLGKGSIGDSPSPRWGDLSRLGNGERSSAAPKARSGPNERARVSQRVRRTDEVNKNFHHEFLHKASLPCRAIAQRRLVIPAEFAETKTAAGRRRMWRTGQAHKAREQWLAVEHQI
jgi:hypothetical protein